jgi:hypothetical protein
VVRALGGGTALLSETASQLRALWIMLGTLSIVQSYSYGARLAGLSGMFCIGIGIWYLLKYRDPEIRAKHVEYWTAKA